MARSNEQFSQELVNVNDFTSFVQFVTRFSGTVGGITDTQRLTAANLLIAEINDPENHRLGNKIGDNHGGLHEESLNVTLQKLTTRHGEYAFLQSTGCCACIASLFTRSKGAAYERVIDALQSRALALFEHRHMSNRIYITADIERGAAGRAAPNRTAKVTRFVERFVHDVTHGVPQNTAYDMLMNMKSIMDANTGSEHYRIYQRHIAAVNAQSPEWKEAYEGRQQSVLGRAGSSRMIRGARGSQ